jgi:hypothetical protein
MDSQNGISMRCDEVKIGTPRAIEADSITGNRIDQEQHLDQHQDRHWSDVHLPALALTKPLKGDLMS